MHLNKRQKSSSMDTKGKIDQLVEETLHSVSNMDRVQTSRFFKEKVLRSLSQQDHDQTEGVTYLNWFTPKYQAAALICFIFLNAAALLNYSSNSYSDNVSSFAEVYGLSETDSDTYLYQN